jgi:hypothetical protein
VGVKKSKKQFQVQCPSLSVVSHDQIPWLSLQLQAEMLGAMLIMHINKIGYGRASVRDFESYDCREYCYMEATLEPWEGVDESLKLLRSQVCSKVNINEDISELEERREKLQGAIKHLEGRIAEATNKWNKIDGFMKKLDAAVEFDPIPF